MGSLRFPLASLGFFFLIPFSGSSLPPIPTHNKTSQDPVILSDVFFIYSHTLGYHIYPYSFKCIYTLTCSKYMFLAINSLLNLNSVLNNFI